MGTTHQPLDALVDRIVGGGGLAPGIVLELLAEETRTMVFYESPHKLVKTLGNFAEYFGADRPVSVSRELSKLYEETIRGTATEVLKHFEEKAPKGEIVIVVAGK